MPPFSGDFIQTVVAPNQYNIPSAGEHMPAPSPKALFFNLELIDEISDNSPLTWDMFANWEEMPTTKHGKSYQILISASTDSEAKPYFKHQRLNIRSAIELQLRCTETSVLLEQNEYIVPLEAVSS